VKGTKDPRLLFDLEDRTRQVFDNFPNVDHSSAHVHELSASWPACSTNLLAVEAIALIVAIESSHCKTFDARNWLLSIPNIF
jgi:hypothetical protein